jgi:hypothetical protein
MQPKVRKTCEGSGKHVYVLARHGIGEDLLLAVHTRNIVKIDDGLSLARDGVNRTRLRQWWANTSSSSSSRN